MAARKRYTAEEAANLLQYSDDESDVSELESDESFSEDVSESEGKIEIVISTPLMEVNSKTGNDPSLLTQEEHGINIDSKSVAQESSKNEQTQDVASSSKSTSKTKKTKSKKKSSEEDNVDIWTSIDKGKISETTHNFEFQPAKEPGVAAHINETFTPIDCFFEFLDNEMLKHIVKMINSYAKQKCQINNPARRRSMMASWKTVTEGEMMRYFAITICMGLHRKPEIRDYWSKKDFYNTTWLAKTMARERFMSIHQTMLHVADMGEKKRKRRLNRF